MSRKPDSAWWARQLIDRIRSGRCRGRGRTSTPNVVLVGEPRPKALRDRPTSAPRAPHRRRTHQEQPARRSGCKGLLSGGSSPARHPRTAADTATSAAEHDGIKYAGLPVEGDRCCLDESRGKTGRLHLLRVIMLSVHPLAKPELLPHCPRASCRPRRAAGLWLQAVGSSASAAGCLRPLVAGAQRPYGDAAGS
jgi:hypothetical protein